MTPAVLKRVSFILTIRSIVKMSCYGGPHTVLPSRNLHQWLSSTSHTAHRPNEKLQRFRLSCTQRVNRARSSRLEPAADAEQTHRAMGKKAKTTEQAALVSSSSNSAEQKPQQETKPESVAAVVTKAKGTSMPPAPVAKPTKPSAERNEFLKLFWNLAENDVEARAQAVAHIIAHLQQKQTKADATFDDDLQYTLKRLVRGLASSRDAARQGFSTALAGLLEVFPSVQLKEVQALLREAMEVHSSMKGMEQREHMFGRLFGLLAVQRSGRLGGDDNQSVAVEVIKELLEMSKWKKWLREACFEAVLAVLVDVNAKVFVSELVPELALYLQGDVSEYNAEQVLLAAGLHHYIHTTGIEATMPSTFPALKFLRHKAMHALAEPLKGSSSCYPRVHAAWYGIFGHLIHTGRNAAQFDGELFQETWNVLVENVLLNKESATHERRGLAFKLFELVLPSLPRPLLRAILTPHFVKCLYTNAVSKKNYLHEAARHTLKVFFALAPEEYFHFFQKQFVKPMASLVEIDADDNDNDEEEEEKEQAAKKMRLSNGGFDAIIAIEEEKERAELLKKKHDNVRLWALDALVTGAAELLAKDVVADGDEATEKVQSQALRFLVFHTFFVSSGKATPSKKKKKAAVASGDVGLDAALTVAEPVLSNTVLANALKRVLSLLSVKLSGESSSVLSRIFSVSQELLACSEAATLRHALAEDVAEQMTAVATRVAEIRTSWMAAKSKDETKTKQLEAFLLLFMSSGVQLLDPEQRSDAVVVVTDLEKCYADLVTSSLDKKSAKKNKKSAKAKNADDDDQDEPNPIVVFTDMLMSLLSQDSSAMREIVAHVFRSMLPLLNAESIQTMLNVLVPSEEDEAEDQDDDRVTRRDDEDEDMDGGDDDDEDDDDDEEEDDEIVLTTATEVSEAMSKDTKLAALNREDMALAAIVGHVKDRANRKKNAKKVVMQVLHFKLRVLDLLQVFVTKCATSPLVLTLVLPLFQALVAIQKTDKETRVLSERLQSVLTNKVLRAKDVPSGAELSAEQRQSACENLKTVVELLTKKSLEKDQAGKVGAGVVVYYIRVLCNSKDTVTVVDASVHEAVAAAVQDAFTKKHSRFPQSVFDDLVTRFPLIAVHLLFAPLTAIATASSGPEDEDEAKSPAAAVDEFSQCEVFRLLSLLLKPKMLADKAEQKAFAAVKTPLKAALVALLARQATQELKAKRMKIVLSCALHFVKSWKQLKFVDADLEDLLAAATALASNSPVVKNMVKQLVDASGSAVAAAALEAAAKKAKDEAATKAKKEPKADVVADKAKKNLKKAVESKKLKQQKDKKVTKRKRAAESDKE